MPEMRFEPKHFEIRTQGKKACREAWAEALPWAKMATVSIYFTHTTVSRIWAKWRQKIEKAGGTQGCSQTVPQSSTDRALRRLTSEFGRDPVYSTRYGR